MDIVLFSWIESGRDGGTCKSPGCKTEAVGVRHWPQPRWGFKPDGQANPDPVLFAEWVMDKLDGDSVEHLDLDSVGPACKFHLGARRATPVHPDQSGSSTGSEGKQPRDSSTNLYQQALAQYGGKCLQCGQTDPVQLQVVVGSGYPSTFFAEHGIHGFNAKYQYLAENHWPAGLCVVRCLACTGKIVSKTDGANVRLRARVIEAYGGVCARCGQDGGSAGLWLVRKSGSAVLRHPGGRKVSSKDKYRVLARLGFPDNHELLCRGCWKKYNSGGLAPGSGDPS